MADAARRIDTIDVQPVFTQADADALNARYEGVSAPDMLSNLLRGELAGRVSVVSSFGTESAVLLHMVAAADPRSDELRVGKECGSTCRSRWSRVHEKKKNK